MQKSGLTEIIPLNMHPKFRASILCFLLLSPLRVHLCGEGTESAEGWATGSPFDSILSFLVAHLPEWLKWLAAIFFVY